MTDTHIPLIELKNNRLIPFVPDILTAATGTLNDHLNRPLRDLRISVTDRCNFRCVYCMPKAVFDKNHSFLPHSALLSFEEITRLARIFIEHGVEKIRLTGGEPLLRKNIERLIEMLAHLRTPSGKHLDITLTTNGSILEKKAQSLYDAGLQRITVSLDALNETVFQKMNDVDFPVSSVLAGIFKAQSVGLSPIKINMVVKRGHNDDQIIEMARYFKGTGIILRFIEYMDVGESHAWNMQDVVSSAEVIQKIHATFPLEPITPQYSGETAHRWRYKDGGGEIGCISSVTNAFCGDCTRARLSTEGQIYLCLFSSKGYDFRDLLRAEYTDEQISGAVAHLWHSRTERYSILRSTEQAITRPKKIEMSYIGG
jgi:GTP 3',8-cyclase